MSELMNMLGRQIEYTHFLRIFNRKMRIGVYPEFDFTVNGEFFQIRADFEKVYLYKILAWEQMHFIDNSEVLLLSSTSIEELLACAYINGEPLISIWSQISYIPMDDDYDYRFCFNDWVYVKSIDKYGVVRATPKDTGLTMMYGISMEGADLFNDPLIKVEDHDLEYDERPETIVKLKDAYQCYLDRLSEPIHITKLTEEEIEELKREGRI